MPDRSSFCRRDLSDTAAFCYPLLPTACDLFDFGAPYVLSFEGPMTTVKFCQNCNNLLYPREDVDKRNLIYGCNSCDYQELPPSNIVYYKEIRRRGDERTPVLNPEPVLPVTKSVRCPKCSHGEATFFQAALKEDDILTLVFVCTNSRCGKRWNA